MTPERRKVALDLLARATPGPWSIDDDGDVQAGPDSRAFGVHVAAVEDFPSIEEEDLDRHRAECEANGLFIAAAPELLLEALDEIERLEREVYRERGRADGQEREIARLERDLARARAERDEYILRSRPGPTEAEDQPVQRRRR